MLATEPPLTPINDDDRPTSSPKPDMAGCPGKSSAIRQLSRPNSSLNAMTPANTTKARRNTAGGAKAARTEPITMPPIAGPTHSFTTRSSTAPLARCVR